MLSLDVLVDYENGSDTSTCGNTTTPCKTLQVAVDRALDGGTITVVGNQYLYKRIYLYKSLIIQGNDNASILPLRKGEFFPAFHAFHVSHSAKMIQ